MGLFKMVYCNSVKSANLQKSVFQNEPGFEKEAPYGQICFRQPGIVQRGVRKGAHLRQAGFPWTGPVGRVCGYARAMMH